MDFEWLYGANAPEKLKLIHPSTRNQGWKREAHDDEFFVTSEMNRFRKHARPTGAWARANGLSRDLIKYWQESFGQLDWFDSWLLCGADPPADVRVASSGEIQRARTAWDFQAILREHGTNRSLYREWLNEDFPQVQTRRQFFSWVWWLFGGSTPPDWFMVPENLCRLKKRLNINGCLNTAGFVRATYQNWNDDPTIKKALDDLRGSVPPMSTVASWRLRHLDVSRTTKENLLIFVEASLLGSALDYVGWKYANWQQYQDEANEVGGEELKDALVAYVRNDKSSIVGKRRHDASGVLDVGLFCPSPTMVKFREAIIKRKTIQRIAQLRGSLPPDCFEQWFFGWTLPRRSSKSDRLWYRKLLDREQKSAGTKPTASTSDVPPDDLVTIYSIANLVNLNHKTVYKYSKDWPSPIIKSGGRGRPAKWSYKQILPDLRSQFSHISFPEHLEQASS